jgi:hypothetical protein
MNRSATHVKRAFLVSGIGLGILLAVTSFFLFWQTSEATIDPSVRYRVLRGVFALDSIPGGETPAAIDQIRHQELWNYVQDLAPAIIEDQIAYFEIGTDGYSAELAHVVQSGIGKEYWILLMDEEDAAGPKGGFQSVTVDETIVHELSHILFGSEAQIQLDETLYRSETYEQWDDQYLALLNDCEGSYMTTEGCSKKDSYINQFYLAFWAELDVYPSYDDYDYLDYVTWYAVTSVDEDIAETFMTFVLEDRPKADFDIRDQKVEFMWSYPELVEIRDEMRAGLR